MKFGELLRQVELVKAEIERANQDVETADVELTPVALIDRDVSLVVATPEPGAYLLHTFNTRCGDATRRYLR